MFIRPTEALAGSKTGLLLWFHTIIPTLLPFMIISDLIINLDMVSYLTYFITPIFHKIFPVSAAGSYAILVGYLCGYPMGAKVTADLVEHKKISKSEGQYLLSFCNNVSPVFLINYIVYDSMNKPELLLPVLFTIYGSSLFYGFLYGKIQKNKIQLNNHITKSKNRQKKETPEFQMDFKILDASIMNSFQTIVKLGGYIILFAIVSRLILYILFDFTLLKSILVGATEITNGIYIISKNPISDRINLILILFFTSFGGFSSIAQTESLIKNSGLSIKSYFFAKLCTASISAIAGAIIAYMFF